MPTSRDDFSRRYSVVAETRRRWSESEKQAIVEEASGPDVNVSAVARRHGIKPSLLFRWRRMAQKEARTEAAARMFLPVFLAPPTAKIGEARCDHRQIEASPPDSRIEIELANGRRLRVGPGVDLGALKRLLDVLDRP